MRFFHLSLWQHLIITSGFLALFIGLTIWFGANISRKVATFIQYKRELIARTFAIQGLAELKKDEKEAEKETIFLKTILPDYEQLIDFSQSVTNIAKRNNIKLTFAFGDEHRDVDTSIRSVYFTLSTQSSYTDFVQFLRDVETSRYIVAFDAFNVARSGDIFQATVNGNVFSQ